MRSVRNAIPLLIVLSLIFPSSGICQQRDLNVVPAAAAGEQRIALLIGNGAYKDAPLKNPPNDAQDVAKVLSNLGFKATVHQNATQKQMKQAIRDFAGDIRRGGVGLFFFAGHGAQSNGRNFLIPVGADIQNEFELEDQAVDANLIVAAMEEAQNRVNIVILDACRNNPFYKSSRSAARGLARMEAARGTFVAFATAPGSVAGDGAGRNGVFTKHLLKSLQEPESDIERVFKRVRQGVSRETGGKQIPWDSSSLIGDFAFHPEQAAKVASLRPSAGTDAQTADSPAIELAFWDTIKNSTNPADFEEYLGRFPNGHFAGLARNRLAAQPSVQASAAPAPAPAIASIARPRPGQGGAGGVKPPASTWSPRKPVSLVVPFAPGGGSDVAGRILARHLTPAVGQPIVIVNKPGGGGSVGAASVAQAAPDGLTLLLANNGIMTVNKALQRSLPFDPQSDFVPIIQFARSPQVLVVPATASGDIRQMASRSLTCASAGQGSLSHLAGEAFKKSTGASWTPVFFAGQGPAATALLGGHVGAAFLDAGSAAPHLKSGKLRALALTGDRRSDALPDVPTFDQLGIPGVDLMAWYGLFASRGTPPEAVGRWYHEVSKVLKDAELRKNLNAMSLDVVDVPPLDLSRALRAESEEMSNLVQWARIAPK